MDIKEVKDSLGRRVLLRGTFGVYETVMREISPSEKFVKLGSATGYFSEAVLGWAPIEEVEILDILK